MNTNPDATLDEIVEAEVEEAISDEYVGADIVDALSGWRAGHVHSPYAPQEVLHAHVDGRLYLLVTNGVSVVAVESPSDRGTQVAPRQVLETLCAAVREPIWLNTLHFGQWVGLHRDLSSSCPRCSDRKGTIYGERFNLATVASALTGVGGRMDGDGEVAWLPITDHPLRAVRIEPEHKEWIIVVLPLNPLGLPSWHPFAPEWPRDLFMLEADNA